MENRNLILSGIALITLAMLVAPVFAGEIGIGAGPTPEVPEVFLLKKAFDICDQDMTGVKSGSTNLPGGSVPPSSQQSGCVDYIGDRFNQYLFTGEQMAMLVAVRDSQGALAITKADLALDGDPVSKCNEIDPNALYKCVPGPAFVVGEDCSPATTKELCDGYGSACQWAQMWFGHDISGDLAQQPPAKSAGTPQGFNSSFDKLYECILTATSAEDMSGEKEVTVIAEDANGNTGESVTDQIWFNPEISIDVFLSSGTSIEFEDGSAGQTVYSTNTLKIKNADTEGGVDVAVWLAGTDLTSSVLPAKCPYSNVLDVETALEYRCKIGTIMNNPWNFVPNPNDKEACHPVLPQDDKPCDLVDRTVGTTGPVIDKQCTCQGALDIVPDAKVENILYAGHTAECWFRLTYPVPCIGLFDSGQILIYARAI